MTDKNTIKNWFQNGMKPTQEQFWAWQDSYWHKTETINQNQIEGLAESLANKADASNVELKANADATNIDVEEWRRELRVGDLPTNIALIDEDDTEGNVYTKEQCNGFLNSKIEIPTYGDDATSMLVGLTDDKIPTLVLLDDVMKNVSNSDMKIPEGQVRKVDVSGAKLLLEGLEDRTSDASFRRRLITNDRGETAYTESSGIQTTFNVPARIDISYPNKINNANYIVPPTTSEDVREIFEMIKGLESDFRFTDFKASEFVLTKKPQERFPQALKDQNYQLPEPFIFQDGKIIKNQETKFPNYFQTQEYLANNEDLNCLYSILFDKELPEDKKWIIRFRSYNRAPLTSEHILAFRNSRDLGLKFDISTDIYYNSSFPHGYYGWGFQGKYLSDKGANPYNYTYLMKVGSKLAFLTHNYLNGAIELSFIDIVPENYKYFKILITDNCANTPTGIIKDISYYIEN